MGQVVNFPTPYPLVAAPQDVARLTDLLNELIVYINTIVYGSNLPAGVLVAANNLSDVANAATSRTNLGLGTAATRSTTAFDAAGAAAAATATALQKASNLSDVANAATARTNLGLGSAATQSTTAFDAAGAAAARAAKGINSDITALTALSVIQKSTNYNVVAGNQTIEVSSSGGAVTITYTPGTAAGRVKVVKTDSTYNPVNISDGTNVLYSLVAPQNGFMQAVEIYSNGASLRVT